MNSTQFKERNAVEIRYYEEGKLSGKEINMGGSILWRLITV